MRMRTSGAFAWMVAAATAATALTLPLLASAARLLPNDSGFVIGGGGGGVDDDAGRGLRQEFIVGSTEDGDGPCAEMRFAEQAFEGLFFVRSQALVNPFYDRTTSACAVPMGQVWQEWQGSCAAVFAFEANGRNDVPVDGICFEVTGSETPVIVDDSLSARCASMACCVGNGSFVDCPL